MASRPTAGRGPSKATGTVRPTSVASVLDTTVPETSSQARPRRKGRFTSVCCIAALMAGLRGSAPCSANSASVPVASDTASMLRVA